MRLGQIARKLSVSSSRVVEYLNTQNVQVDDNANTKLPDDLVAKVFKHFSPELYNQLIRDINADKKVRDEVKEPVAFEPELLPEISVPMVETATKEAEKDNKPAEQHQPTETPLASQSEVEREQFTTEREVEVIKAPKVELQGLKVVGKIELPEPKKKENSAPISTDATDDGDAKDNEISITQSAPQKRRKAEEVNREPRHKRDAYVRPRKNPISLQREREEREAEERRKEEALKRKEKRTEYYLKRVKPSVPTKAAKLVDEPLTDMQEEIKQPPKTWWGKFVRWLTT